MLGAWRYIILISTIWGFNPSTDPLTQLLYLAILLLYFSGLGILFYQKLIYIMKYPYLKVFKLWQLTSFLKVFICFNIALVLCSRVISISSFAQQNYSNPRAAMEN
jgi:hypothetical protein